MTNTVPLSALVDLVAVVHEVLRSTDISSKNFNRLNEAVAPVAWRVKEMLEKQQVEVTE